MLQVNRIWSAFYPSLVLKWAPFNFKCVQQVSCKVEMKCHRICDSIQLESNTAICNSINFECFGPTPIQIWTTLVVGFISVRPNRLKMNQLVNEISIQLESKQQFATQLTLNVSDQLQSKFGQRWRWDSFQYDPIVSMNELVNWISNWMGFSFNVN